jgi:hypothetical protein
MSISTVEQRLSDLEARISKLEKGALSAHLAHKTGATQKKISAKEYLMTKQLNTETQKTLVLGYYLEHVEGMPSFNVDDLVAVFQAAKEKRPKNMNDAVNKNVARGLLMEAVEKKEAKKAWVLTSTGEKHVQDELNK